jgi:EipB-like
MQGSIRKVLAGAALVLSTGAAGAQAVKSPGDLIVPHRAVYDITLARSDEGSGVSSATGRMVFEIKGSACEGYSMRQRMVVHIGDEEGNIGLLDFRISTFESGNGDRYTFDARTTMNDELVEAVEGEARRSQAGIEVKLKQPQVKTVALDSDTLFPSQHLQAILSAAVADRDFVAVEIYEGAGTGEASDAASASIGDAVLTASDGLLRRNVRHWPISVGYFNGEERREEGFGEELPNYQMHFTLYENGVTNDLVMDYGNYALSGALNEIQPLDSSACPLP